MTRLGLGRAGVGWVDDDLRRDHDDPSRFVLYEGWARSEALDLPMTVLQSRPIPAGFEDMVAEQRRPFRAVSLPVAGERVA